MEFIKPSLPVALDLFKKLEKDTQPLWGTMSSLDLVEHITDSLQLAQGKIEGVTLAIPEDKLDRAKKFLFSEHPMPKNFQIPWRTTKIPNGNNNLEEALAELEQHWIDFEAHFENHPEIRHIHPSFGNLNYKEWQQVHSKHLTHHFQQFGLIPS